MWFNSTLSGGAAVALLPFRPAGSRWGTKAFYFLHGPAAAPTMFLLFGDGTVKFPPIGFPAIVPPAPLSWRGDVGEGIERDWEFSEAVESRIGGQAWWREDLRALWNRRTGEVISPPAWMPQQPGENQFVSWGVQHLPQIVNRRGVAAKNAARFVRVHIDFLQPENDDRLFWYAQNRVYQVWPPYSKGG